MQDFNYDEYLTTMSNDKNRHIQIIAKYLVTRGIQYDSKEKMQMVIKRHIRAARDLSVFSDDELKRAATYCKTKYYNIDWTLETMLKVLATKQLSDTNQQLNIR